jgi:DNA-directed RNA polymerase specialized sigma24 family protein
VCAENAHATETELGEFYREFYLPLVRRVIRKHGLEFQDAHDLVQDAFTLAISKLNPAKNPKAWLYQVVDHLCANFRRKRGRRAKLLAQWNPSPRREISLNGSRDDD